MSKTVLAQINGWTPLLDRLVERHGLITAAVFGKVWRYCQGDYGVCTASQDRIAKELGISRKAVNEHCKILVENGYLEVQNNGRTNTYRDTGKAGLLLQITAIEPPTEPVTESYTSETTCNPGLQQVSPTVTADVTQGYTKKVVKKVRDITTTTTAGKNEIYAAYEKNIGPLTPYNAQELDDLEKFYTREWVIEAMKEAASSGVFNLKYIKAILQRWKSQGFKSDRRQPKTGASPALSPQAQANRQAVADAAARDKKILDQITLEEDENGNIVF